MPIFIATGAPSSTMLQQIANAITPIVSVIGALIVVNRTNKANAIAQKDRLNHESSEAERERSHSTKQAEIDRLHNARKDLAMTFAKSLTSLNAHLGTLATSSLPFDGSPFKKFAIAAHQLQIVVEPSTAAKIEKLVAEYSRMHIALMVKIIPALRTQDRLNALVNTEKLRGTDVQDIHFQIHAARSQLQHQKLNAYSWVVSEAATLAQFRFDTVSAVREDLFADGDLSEARMVFDQGWSRLQPLFNDLIDTIDDGS
jgi:hypothetical protein